MQRYNKVRVGVDVRAAFIYFWSLVQTSSLTQRCVVRQGSAPERLVSGSDDFTLFLWNPAEDKKPLARLTGHSALVNEVLFSPDTRLLASASFDKSIKIWDGRNGK